MKWIMTLLTLMFATNAAQAFENILVGQSLNRSMRASGLVQIRPFTTDGCSMSPNGNFTSDWTECCVDHDVAYWVGGSRTDRLRADTKLMACIAEKSDIHTAQVYFTGVRTGGRPFSIMPYRWGYGWNYLRTYQALTEQEKEIIKGQLGKSLEEMHKTLLQTPITPTPLSTGVVFDYCDQLSIKTGHLGALRGEVKDISMTVDPKLSMVKKKYFVQGESTPREVHFSRETKVLDCYDP